jgi:hypothetical protein
LLCRGVRGVNGEKPEMIELNALGLKELVDHSD